MNEERLAELVYAARSARDWFAGAIRMDEDGEHEQYRANPVTFQMLENALHHFQEVKGEVPENHLGLK